MITNWSQIFSISLHLGIAGLAYMYQPALVQLPQGDGLFVELQEGPTPQGKDPIPVVEKVEKVEPQLVVEPVKEKVIETKPEIAQPLPESAPVVTQTQESPVKAAPEQSQPVEGLGESIKSAEENTIAKNFGVENGIQDARLLKQKNGNKPPAYPIYDRFHKRQGRVVVLGFIDDSGKVKKTKLESSSGSLEMNKEALKAFALYRFEKGQRGWVRMPFDFVLNGPAEKLNGVRQRTNRKIQ